MIVWFQNIIRKGKHCSHSWILYFSLFVSICSIHSIKFVLLPVIVYLLVKDKNWDHYWHTSCNNVIFKTANKCLGRASIKKLKRKKQNAPYKKGNVMKGWDGFQYLTTFFFGYFTLVCLVVWNHLYHLSHLTGLHV